MSKHTPGPHKANNGYTIINGDRRHFPIHARKRGMIGSAFREGDAVLWAAAPELFAALEMARNGLQWYQDEYPEAADGSDDEAMQQIDAAIAKATGSV